MDKREFNNILQIKKLSDDIIEAIYASDIDRLREIKGELKAMESVVTPLEMAMGLIVGAITEYQRQTKVFEEEENESRKTKKGNTA